MAWIEDDLIAFLYLPANSNSELDLWNWKVILYSLDSATWNELEFPSLVDCRTSWFSKLQRLPNQHLGFIVHCLEKSVDEGFDILYEWNPKTNNFVVLREFAPTFFAGQFSFSPDMDEFLQENTINIGLGNQLFHSTENNELTRIFPEWRRAKEPAWSPDGKAIAFLGNPSIETSSSPKAFDPIENEFLFPWNLYTMESGMGEVELLLEGSADRLLKWSPQGRILSVMGEYYDSKGIWLVDSTTSDVTRIWADMNFYDWSPKGDEIVIIHWVKKGDTEFLEPIIIKVPIEWSSIKN